MHGGDIYNNKIKYDFSVNLNPEGASPFIKASIYDSFEVVDWYPETDSASLKEILSEKIKVPVDYIGITNGASEAILGAVYGLNPVAGAIEIPAFSGYERALEACGVSDISFYSREQILKKDYGFKSGEVLFVASPSNPMGNLLAKDDIKRLYEDVRNSNAYLLLDECFVNLSDNPKNTMINEIADNPDYYKRLIVIRSFTKTFAIPGIRLGYFICSDRLIVKNIMNHLPEWNVSGVALVAGKACLELLKNEICNYQLIATEREYMYSEFKKLGIDFFPSDSVYVLFKSTLDLYNQLLRKGILIRDCSDYKGLGTGYFRVAVKNHNENKVLIDAIKEIYDK